MNDKPRQELVEKCLLKPNVAYAVWDEKKPSLMKVLEYQLIHAFPIIASEIDKMELPQHWFDNAPDAPDPDLVSYKTIADEVRHALLKAIKDLLIKES